MNTSGSRELALVYKKVIENNLNRLCLVIVITWNTEVDRKNTEKLSDLS